MDEGEGLGCPLHTNMYSGETRRWVTGECGEVAALPARSGRSGTVVVIAILFTLPRTSANQPAARARVLYHATSLSHFTSRPPSFESTRSRTDLELCSGHLFCCRVCRCALHIIPPNETRLPAHLNVEARVSYLEELYDRDELQALSRQTSLKTTLVPCQQYPASRNHTHSIGDIHAGQLCRNQDSAQPTSLHHF